MHYGWSWENGTIKAAGIQLTNSTLSTPRPRVIGIAQNGTLHRISQQRLQRQPISREVEVCQGFTNCSLTVTPLERRNFSPVEIRGMLDGKKRWRIRLVGKVTKVPACTCFMVQKSTFALLPGVWKFWFLIKKFPFSRFCHFSPLFVLLKMTYLVILFDSNASGFEIIRHFFAFFMNFSTTKYKPSLAIFKRWARVPDFGASYPFLLSLLMNAAVHLHLLDTF